MSSTNPEPGRDPLGALTHLPAGTPAHDDHNGAGPPTDAVIKRGYEEDGYDNKSVIGVPILVIVFFVLAFSDHDGHLRVHPPGKRRPEREPDGRRTKLEAAERATRADSPGWAGRSAAA